MSKWGCGNAGKADAVRARRYRQREAERERQLAKAADQAMGKAAVKKRKGKRA